MGKTAFLTGITGQDGSYLAEHLLARGYAVHGLVRRSSTTNLQRIEHLHQSVTLHDGDLLDQGALTRVLGDVRPDEIYNLAAQSHVHVSFRTPVFTADVNGLGPLRLLEAIRQAAPKARFYQASTSEMFGRVLETPQRETTPFRPRSPYGCAKAFAHYQVANYRESYGLFACCGILFNHESPRRQDAFVTRKITRAAARIKAGLQDKLRLGNLEAKRDWGFAGDYVAAMHLMLQADAPDDYVIATGETHTIREFCEAAFGHLGLRWEDHVVQDPELYRPADVELLLGDPSRAKERLGWRPAVGFRELVRLMADADFEEAAREARAAKEEMA